MGYRERYQMVMDVLFVMYDSKVDLNPSVTTLSRVANMDHLTAKKIVAELESKGLVEGYSRTVNTVGFDVDGVAYRLTEGGRKLIASYMDMVSIAPGLLGWSIASKSIARSSV